MRPRNHSHTTILRKRVVNREPQCDHPHWFERPVAAILMPQHGLSIVRRLTDVMRSKERNVGPDVLLRNIQQARITDEPDPKWIIGYERVAKLLGPQLRMFF